VSGVIHTRQCVHPQTAAVAGGLVVSAPVVDNAPVAAAWNTTAQCCWLRKAVTDNDILLPAQQCRGA
jgi:hypothetical protein